MKLVIASNNQGKLREIREIMEGSGIEVLSQREAGCEFEVDETGTSYEENARIKATAAMRATGLPAVADDSGIEIEAYGWGPGIHSHRFLNGRSYPEACRDIVKELQGRTDRAARYCCAVVCCFPDGREICAFATTEGEIAHAVSSGRTGFGYDPMFLLPEGRTMADLSEEEKNAISHRGRAFRQLLEKLENGEYDVKQ